jgi:putative membrane protein
MPEDPELSEESSDPEPSDRLDVDVRFLLANERTLLAWLRTALTLLAAGVGLLHFVPEVPLSNMIGFGLLVLGAAGALIGQLRYRGADTAMREGRMPPRGVVPDAMALGVFALAVLLVVLVMTRHATTI